MAPILYQDLLFPPSQSVVLTIRKAGLDSVVESRAISLGSGDQLKPDFVKKFPMHTVPALEDDGFYLWDSHAINAYLLSKYAKDDTLYPKDHQKRAKVDQWLQFANAILYTRLRDISELIWMKKTKVIPEDKAERAAAGFKMLEELLGDNKFLCGDVLTLADISCVVEYYGLTAFTDVSKFKSLADWAQRCQEQLPGFQEIVIKGNEGYKSAMKQMMSA